MEFDPDVMNRERGEDTVLREEQAIRQASIAGVKCSVSLRFGEWYF